MFAKVMFTYGAGLLAGGLLVAASAVTGADSDFMKFAAKGGLAEVELGQMAAQKASDPGVKEFANRMIRDHSKANTALSELASSKGVLHCRRVKGSRTTLRRCISKCCQANNSIARTSR